MSIGELSYISAQMVSEVRFEGENVILQNANVNAWRGGGISVGRKTWFNSNLFMTVEQSDIKIGNDNMFSRFVKMSTGNHKVIDKKSGEDITNRNRIKTGDHVWVGMGATLLPGCDVGNNCIVGAAAVVTKSMETNTACAGNPAVVIKRDIDWER